LRAIEWRSGTGDGVDKAIGWPAASTPACELF
jgi:hypothetical protein